MIDPTDRRTDGQTDTSLRRLRYDTRCYFNVRSKADISQLNLPRPASINTYVRNYKKVFISTQQNEHRPVYTFEVEQ